MEISGILRIKVQFKKLDYKYLKLLLDGRFLENCIKNNVKGALSGLRQFLVTESPLKMMKNVFYFTSKALFILKMFKFLS